MKCSEAALRVDLLYEELAPKERSRLLAHVEQCRDCRERWSQLLGLSAAADRWVAPPPPRGIAERALARVASERTREFERQWTHVSPEQLLRRMGLGAGAAVVSLLLTAGAAAGQVTPLAIGVIGVVWTVLYAGLLLTASHAKLRPVIRSALGGAGVALILVPPLSVPSVVEFCARLVRSAPESVSFAMLLVLFAAGYTAGPLLVGGVVFGRSRQGSRVTDGAMLSVFYALLIAPAAYLQCVSLPLDVTAVWTAGAVLGTGLAGQVSLRLAALRTRLA